MSAYARLLAELAVPRLVGSPGHAAVYQRLREELAKRGYVNLEHEFPVHPPGALAGPATAGAVLAWVCLALGLWRTLGVSGGLLILLVGLAGLGLAIALRAAHADSRTGMNIIAVRPRAQVAVWLVAHYDSKGQPMSMLGRLVGAGLAALGVPSAAALVVTAHPLVALVLVLPGIIGGLVLLQNRATNRSPGAVDNASALVTILATLDRLPPQTPIGVLFLDAEEYGMLGARALVRDRANLIRGATVINLDGIDDRGPTRCFVHRPGPLTGAVAAALGARATRALPVFVDGLVLAPATAECVTIMRGDWRTAAIVHTRADRPERLTLGGSELVAAGLARALGERVDSTSGRP
ncbi:MAG TPA: M28 family peptidase [Gemmatimonadales bacterium]|nr:M28 family peptidase [Gemmatimonadales bacterium]